MIRAGFTEKRGISWNSLHKTSELHVLCRDPHGSDRAPINNGSSAPSIVGATVFRSLFFTMESEDIAKLMAVKDDPVPCVLLKPDGSVEEPVVDMTPSKGARRSALRGCSITRPAPALVCATPACSGLTRAVARRRGGARLAGRAGHHLRPVRAGWPRRAERRGAHPPTAQAILTSSRVGSHHPHASLYRS